MGAVCNSNSKQNQYLDVTINNQIEEKLQNLKKSKPAIQILLLGDINSGKSTIVRQLKQIFDEPYNELERIKFIPFIRKQCIQQIKLLLRLYDIKYFDTNHRLSTTLLDAKKYLNNFQIKDIHFSNNIPLNKQIVSSINIIWNAPLFKKFYHQIEDYKNIHHSSSYFWNMIHKLNSNDYIPSNKDILMLKHDTKNTSSHTFSMNMSSYCTSWGEGFCTIIDSYIQSSSHYKKYLSYCNYVDCIIFVVSMERYVECRNIINMDALLIIGFIKCFYYNQIPIDIISLLIKFYPKNSYNRNLNGIKEQIELFKTILDYKMFHNKSVILFFNKYDLFEEKIKNIPITVEFEDFTDTMNPNDPDDVVKFIASLFLDGFEDKNINLSTPLFIHRTNALDLEKMEKIFRDTFLDLYKLNLRSYS